MISLLCVNTNHMKFAIISDIHDNLANLEKFLYWAKENGIESVICCGDVASSETLTMLAKSFAGHIYLVRGNAELYTEAEARSTRDFPNLEYLGRIGRIEIGGRKIGICHEPFLIEKVIEAGDCEIVFYGHTHKPWIEEKDSFITANPGTLGGVLYKASFAVWDSKSGEIGLKILEQL